MSREYKHYKNFPKDKWRWPDFSPREMSSGSGGALMIDEDSMDKLQRLRNLIGLPITINSAYRSKVHNDKVGSTDGSMHRKAKAYDIPMANHNAAQFEAAARQVGFTGFGFYPISPTNKTVFMHIDTGPPREWAGKKTKGRWFEKALFYAGNIPIPDMAPTRPEYDPEYDIADLFELPPTPKRIPVTTKGGAIGALVIAVFAALVLKFEEIIEKIGGIF